MNKFEQVSSLGYKMSLAGGTVHGGGGDRALYVRPVQRGAGLYSEVQCILGSGPMHTGQNE